MIRQWLRLVTERRPLSLWVHGVVLAAMLCGWVGTQARAASVNGYARGCDVTSNAVTQWRLINPLNTNTAVGTVLWQRTLTLHTSFNLAVSGRPRELVTAGHWTPGTPQYDGAAPTDVAGIGLRLEVVPQGGKKIRVAQVTYPIALEKNDDLVFESGLPKQTMVTQIIQSLILTVPPDQLPTGTLKVTQVTGSSYLQLYAYDLEKNESTLGAQLSQLSAPLTGSCRTSLVMGGMDFNINIELPKTCVVEAYKEIGVRLGRFALSDFPQVNATSPAVPFSIGLSRCSMQAKPRISFIDKSGGSSVRGVLGLINSSTRGFGIVMTNGLTSERIEYSGQSYEMQRIGDGASIPLRASYIRIGNDQEVEAGGEANGAAEFTFTFP